MTIKRVNSPQELQGIKDLQTANLWSTLGEEEAMKEGFVTAQYSIAFLEEMHRAEPSIIAVDDDRVIGYALVATREVSRGHELLGDLCKQIETHSYKVQTLTDINYVLVGQLCVAKSHRGRGLVPAMYDFYRKELSGKYSCVLTEVDQRNPRSVKAHLSAGFEILGTLNYGGSQWHIVISDWRR